MMRKFLAALLLLPALACAQILSGTTPSTGFGANPGISGQTTQPSFAAALTTSVVPAIAVGSPTATFSRATTATVTDQDSLVRPVLSGEVRFQGARRVQNLVVGSSEAFAGASWNVQAGVTRTAGQADPFGGTTAVLVTTDALGKGVFQSGDTTAIGDTLLESIWLRSDDAAQVSIERASGGPPNVSITLDSTWRRYVTPAAAVTFNTSGLYIRATARATSFYVAKAQVEKVGGQPNQAPAEYVSVGVLASPFNGANVDGVQYFGTQNGNSVSSNIVTEAAGRTLNGYKYGVSDGAGTSNWNTPGPNTINGDIDVRVNLSVPNWNNGSAIFFFNGMPSSTDRAWRMSLQVGGILGFEWSTTGSNVLAATSSTAVVAANGSALWVRATLQVNNGAGGFTVTFYTSGNGQTWTQLGTPQTSGGTTSIFRNAGLLQIGSTITVTGPINIYYGEVRSGINGTVVKSFDPYSYVTGSTFTSATGEVWTFNGTALIIDPKPMQGYLAEGSRTNLSLSSTFLATWAPTRATLTASAVVSPDGLTAGATLVDDASAATTHFTAQVINTTAATVYTWSVWGKTGPGSKRWLALNSDLINVGFEQGIVDLSNCTVSQQAFGSSVTVKSYPNGWCYITATGAARATAALNFQFMLANAASGAGAISYSGDGVSGNAIWGAQVEAGSFASSYIPTLLATVTRNADALTYPSASNVSGTIGTVYAEASLTGQNVSIQTIVAGPNASAAPLYLYTNGASLTSIQNYDGAIVLSKPGITSLATVQKLASAWGGATKSVTGAGLAPASGAFDGDMNVGATIEIGTNGGSFQAFGTIRNVVVFPTKFTDAQMQGQTGP